MVDGAAPGAVPTHGSGDTLNSEFDRAEARMRELVQTWPWRGPSGRKGITDDSKQAWSHTFQEDSEGPGRELLEIVKLVVGVRIESIFCNGYFRTPTMSCESAGTCRPPAEVALYPKDAVTRSTSSYCKT